MTRATHPFVHSPPGPRGGGRALWTIGALLVAAAVLVIVAVRAPMAGADTSVEVYPMPGGTVGDAIVTDQDGAVWFATGDSGSTPRIGRLDAGTAAPGTSDGMTFYPTPTFTGAPCCATFIRSLAYDAVGRHVWFVRSDGMYGYGRTAEMQPGTGAGFAWNTVKYQNGGNTGYIGLWGIAYDPVTRSAWIAQHATTNVAPTPGYYPGARMALTDDGLGLTEAPNIALQGGRTTIDSARYDAKPRGPSIAAAGQAWFAQSNPGLPGWRIARTNGTGDYTEYLIQPCVGTPCSGSNTGTGPTDTAVASDGSVWFTNELNRSIGRLDVNASTFTTYTLAAIDARLASGRPAQIRAAADGTLWVAVAGGISAPSANAVVRIVPSPQAPTATVYPTGASAPISIAPSATGDVWFGLLNQSAGTGAIGRLAGVLTGGSGTPSTPAPPGSGSQPAAPAPQPGVITLKPSAIGVAKPGAVTTSTDTASITQICVGPPEDRCSLVYLLQSHEYVKGFPGTVSNERTAMARENAKKKPVVKKKKKPPFPILGKVSVTLKGGQKKTTKVRLSPKARIALAKKGTLRATLIVQQRTKTGTLKTIQKKPVVFRAKKKPAKVVRKK